jgi:hypothetical protein
MNWMYWILGFLFGLKGAKDFWDENAYSRYKLASMLLVFGVCWVIWPLFLVVEVLKRMKVM